MLVHFAPASGIVLAMLVGCFVLVFEGDAHELPALRPPDRRGRIGSVLCGTPLALLSLAEQRRFTDATAAVAPGRGFLHYSCRVTSPLPTSRHRFLAKREA